MKVPLNCERQNLPRPRRLACPASFGPRNFS